MRDKNKISIIISVLFVAIFIIYRLIGPGEEYTHDGAGDAVEYSQETEQSIEVSKEIADRAQYTFRNEKLLLEHFEKHGEDMGFDSPEESEKAASKVVNNPEVLHKIEAEDGDDIYYLEETNEFVVVSTDGYIRTYFKPDAGKSYFDRQ